MYSRNIAQEASHQQVRYSKQRPINAQEQDLGLPQNTTRQIFPFSSILRDQVKPVSLFNHSPLSVIADLPENPMNGDSNYQNSLNDYRIKLNLENLQCYEVVTEQFGELGIIFNNALALQPSNSAYLPRRGKMVLMASPKNGWIEANFTHPVTYFNCYVTSSQRTMLSAYNGSQELVSRIETAGANLANFESEIAPNARLTVTGSEIVRITLECFDGQLVVNDLSFS